MCYCFLTVIFSYLLCIIFYCFFCLFYFFFFFFFFLIFFFFFFFQAEDGIRDADVTGDQTCALPILVYVPRDIYSTDLRIKMANVLIEALQAEDLEFTTYFSESILARTMFVLRVQPVENRRLGVQEIGRASCRERV